MKFKFFIHIALILVTVPFVALADSVKYAPKDLGKTVFIVKYGIRDQLEIKHQANPYQSPAKHGLSFKVNGRQVYQISLSSFFHNYGFTYLERAMENIEAKLSQTKCLGSEVKVISGIVKEQFNILSVDPGTLVVSCQNEETEKF